MALRNHFKDLIELQSFVSPLLILSYMNKRVFYRLGQKTEMIKFPLIGTKRQRTHCIPNPWKWYHYKQGLTRPDQRFLANRKVSLQPWIRARYKCLLITFTWCWNKVLGYSVLLTTCSRDVCPERKAELEHMELPNLWLVGSLWRDLLCEMTLIWFVLFIATACGGPKIQWSKIICVSFCWQNWGPNWILTEL